MSSIEKAHEARRLLLEACDEATHDPDPANRWAACTFFAGLGPIIDEPRRRFLVEQRSAIEAMEPTALQRRLAR